jgi:hypothetical protein
MKMTREEAERYVYVSMCRGDIEDRCKERCIQITNRSNMEQALIEDYCGEYSAPSPNKARNYSLHCKKDGRIFQMRSGVWGGPMRFSEAKHNYTKKDIDSIEVGGAMSFQPMFGNENPVSSTLVRIK